MVASAQQRSIRLVLLIGLALLALPILSLLSHTSQEPEILGRYSLRHFVMLLAYLGLLLACGLAIWLLPRFDSRRFAWIPRSLNWLRAHKWLFAIVLVAPWLAAVAAIEALELYDLGQLATVQIAFLGMVVLFDIVLIVGGRPSGQVREPLALTLLFLFSLIVSLVVLELGLRMVPKLVPQEVQGRLPGGGRYLREDMIFEQPMREGFRFTPMQDYAVDWKLSDGGLINWQKGRLTPVDPAQDRVVATFRFVTDENGFLNQPPLLDDYDVVVAGDSFGTQTGVTEPWPRVLERASSKSVLNLSMPGYSPQAEVEATKAYGLDRHPEWVIVAYFEGNDLYDAEAYNVRRESGLSWPRYDQSIAGPYRSSVTLQTVRYGVEQLIDRSMALIRSPAQETAKSAASYTYPVTATLTGHPVELVFADPYLSILTVSKKDLEASENLRLIEESFQDLKQASEASGANVLIVYAPSKERIYLPLIQDQDTLQRVLHRVASVRLGDNGYLQRVDPPAATPESIAGHIDDQRNAFRDLAERNGIQFLDLTPAFQERTASGEELYHLYDTHWNQAGHELAGQLVAEYIHQE